MWHSTVFETPNRMGIINAAYLGEDLLVTALFAVGLKAGEEPLQTDSDWSFDANLQSV